MFGFLRSDLVATLLFLLLPLSLLGDDAKPPATSPELAAADQLYRAGKFADAETNYEALLKNDSTLVPAEVLLAQVGLVRAMLRQQKIDEALDAANAALAQQPNAAALLAAKGDVQFRRGEMPDAEVCYLTAKKLDPKDVHAYLGLARLYSSYSLYRKAYDLLQSAHEVAPDDIEVQRAWLRMLPRKERLTALEAYLAGPHPDDEEETKWMTEYFGFLKATADKPVHACRLVSKVEQTKTKLEPAYGQDIQHLRGIRLDAELNDHSVRLLLDTGAGGIMVNRKLAEKSGLTPISAVHYGGIGDKGLQSGYTAVADHIRIGELEFQDCVISVSDKGSVADQEGLIGADVFGAYLVDIDLPGMQLKLSPLPKRPEDAVAPTSLNSEGEEQANAEQKEDSEKEGTSKDQNSPPPTRKQARHLPKDRYIAPEMADWTKVFRFGHSILVPTSVNNSKAMLFGLDTGAFSNLLSVRAGRQVSKVSSEDRLQVHGVNGAVTKVYSSDKATLRFAHFEQSNLGIITLDLSTISRHTGTEVSGFLGFAMLRQLEIELDYRDGLVDFKYDPKRVNPFVK
ncbi:MAG TPA: aspartyl protease family protein [Candidatus Eremiobacteraceae bacterium]|nr:aspartyl protease family protein [Candidatus Eremiobacteraceae bacterium]